MAEVGAVVLLFEDDSRMKIRTGAPASASLGGKVKSAQEAEAELKICAAPMSSKLIFSGRPTMDHPVLASADSLAR
jgi:hypothetical protein